MMFSLQRFGQYKESEQASSLKQRDYKDATDLVIRGGWQDNLDGNENVVMSSQKQHCGISNDDTCTTLTSQEKERPVVGNTVVRRLTPLECERLQGFPDGWTLIGELQPKYDADGNVVEIERYYIGTDGKRKKVSDSARYKALGNSIATPFWFYLLRRIAAQYERPATLGSLFSGIGGFDLCWEMCNGPGTAIWQSEIEEFPIAVCKQHFGDEVSDKEGDLWKILSQSKDTKTST